MERPSPDSRSREMDTDDQRQDRKQKEIKARRIVSERLHRFYGNLLSGFKADADEFFSSRHAATGRT